MRRFRLATFNYLSGVFYTIVSVVVGLFATPYLVRWLNAERFGAARTAVNLYAMLSLLEFGLSGSIAPLLARALGRNDDRALRSTLVAGFRAYVLVTIPIMLTGAALTPFVDRIISVSPPLQADLRLAWIVSLLMWPTLCLTPLRGLIETEQRGYRIQLLMAAQNVLIVAASLIFAKLGWGITGQLAAIALGVVSFSLALAWDVHRRRPGVLQEMVLARPDPEASRAVWGLSRPTLLFNLSGKLGLMTDYLIVGKIVGTAGVTALDLTQRLATMALGQILNIGNASWAGLAELHAQGHMEQFRRRIVELTRLVVLLGICGLGPIIAYNDRFLSLWLHEQAPKTGPWIIVVSALNTLLIGIFSLWGWCFSGTGRIARVVAPSALGAIFNFLLSIVLTLKFGIIGPLLGTSAVYLLNVLIFIPRRLHSDFGVSRRELTVGILVPFVWGLPYSALLYAIARIHDPAGWLDLLTGSAQTGRAHRLAGWFGIAFEMSAAALAFLLLAGRFLLGAEDRRIWMSRIAGLFSVFRKPRAVVSEESLNSSS